MDRIGMSILFIVAWMGVIIMVLGGWLLRDVIKDSRAIKRLGNEKQKKSP